MLCNPQWQQLLLTDECYVKHSSCILGWIVMILFFCEDRFTQTKEKHIHRQRHQIKTEQGVQDWGADLCWLWAERPSSQWPNKEEQMLWISRITAPIFQVFKTIWWEESFLSVSALSLLSSTLGLFIVTFWVSNNIFFNLFNFIFWKTAARDLD